MDGARLITSHLAAVIVTLALSACDDPEPKKASGPTPVEPSFPDGPQMTWEEWKAHQKPIRDEVPEGERYNWHRVGSRPNMELWQPEDFLPKKGLKAEHVDLCELPLEHRREVAKIWRWYNGDRDAWNEDSIRAIARRYARRGVVQAQAMMGVLFDELEPDAASDPSRKTRHARRWLERAAASGEPLAMHNLALFQREILEAAGTNREQVPLTDFRWDEVMYWHWRAARGFNKSALWRMDGLWVNYEWQKIGYLYREHVKEYKWGRLRDLVDVLVSAYRNPVVAAESVIKKYRPHFNKHQIALAEREVGEFVRANKQRLARYRQPFGCPDMTWLNPDAPTFDWEALNAEIQQYGVQVEQAGNRWTVRDDWPPGDDE